MNEWQLIRRYVENGSEESFTQLAGRYLNLVYSTCLREIGDRHLAEDATQVVFLLLARKAPTLRRSILLSGWLFRTARFVSKNMRRRERRRSLLEQAAVREAVIQNAPAETGDGEPDTDWETIQPHLNTALAALRPPERNILLLRFFEDRSLAEVGAVLGLTEDAARMRVMRALEKMRRQLGKSGSALTVAAVAVLLSERAVQASPTACADALPRIAAGGAAGAVAAKAGGVLAGWHIHQMAHAITQALWKANLKVAAAWMGVGLVATTSVPLIVRDLRPPVPSTSVSFSAPTRAEAARQAAQQIADQRRFAKAALQFSEHVQALGPGGQQKLTQAMLANMKTMQKRAEKQIMADSMMASQVPKTRGRKSRPPQGRVARFVPSLHDMNSMDVDSLIRSTPR